MKKQPLITILMATYNGGRYIEQQLDSLINQTYTNWKLLIRDDGSTDGTIQIIEKYKAGYSNITCEANVTGNKGACLNFSVLFDIAMKDKSVGYLMFCDQDDIWKPNKIENSLVNILALEDKFDAQPFLAYTDLEIMDEDGRVVPRSFKIKHTIALKNILSYNYVFGCTLILNRAMMEKIKSIPPIAVNHDYWIALVASGCKTIFIGERNIRYRQHSNNTSLNYKGNNTILERLRRLVFFPEKEINYLVEKLQMFSAFYAIHQNELSRTDKRILEEYLESFRINRLQVCYVMIRNRMFRKGFFQTAAAWFQVIFFYKKISNKM